MIFSAFSSEGTISFGLGSAPAPGAADDALVVGIGRRVLVNRARNYACVQREGAPNRSRGGCAPRLLRCRRAARFALAALIIFFAVGVRAQTTNTLSDAEIKGRELARQLCEVRPETNFTQSAILVIRTKSGGNTSNSITCQIFVTQKNWTTIYTPNGAPPVISSPFNKIEYVITHAGDGENIYTLTHNNPFTHGEQPISFATPFANSDFWLCDLGLEFFHWPQQKVLPHPTPLMRTRSYTLLESTNPNPSTDGYSRVLSWIDKESGGILQAEAYDAQGKLLKVFEPGSFKKDVSGQWQLQEMEIRNVQTKSRTRLEFDLKK